MIQEIDTSDMRGLIVEMTGLKIGEAEIVMKERVFRKEMILWKECQGIHQSLEILVQNILDFKDLALVLIKLFLPARRKILI